MDALETLTLFIVSDSTGETAEHVALAAISQFDTDFSKIVRYRYVEGSGKIDEVVSRAAAVPSIVVCTLVDRQTRSVFAEKTAAAGIPFVDLLGPMVDALEMRLGRKPLQAPGLLRKLDEDYFQKIKAVEFAIQCDDGRSTESLPEADLVILGVSRTGKTPLSMYIANKGFKAANIPLIPEVDPPEIIRKVPSSRSWASSSRLKGSSRSGRRGSGSSVSNRRLPPTPPESGWIGSCRPPPTISSPLAHASTM